MRGFLVALLVVCSACLCSAQTVTYSESFADIQNPDRGFYQPIDGVASSFTPLTATQLASLRNTYYTPWQGNYSVSPTIIFRHYVLDLFKSANLSSAFLSGVQADFNAARAAGVRLLLRFSYTITPPTGSCGSWICPPYGDAPKSIVLAHIAQLKPYLQGNSDVILAVQSGFIGVWGEQYYSDYFGDASAQGKLTNQNWQDRIDVLNALLDAVPANRMVQVRYPQMKQKLIYGLNAPVISAALISAQAHNQTNIARIGFHNDCFLSATDDQGTYWDYGNSTTSASNQTAALKPYSANDSKYVAVGGETCSDAFSPQNDCSGQAVADMDLLNYSYLNSNYNNDVNNDWQTGGCLDVIKRRLGYRFVMRSGTFPASGNSGESLSFTLSVDNVGFAAPFNPRTLTLILRNTSTAQIFAVNITGENSDTRFWLSGQTVNLNKTVTLPNGMPNGNYELLLHLSDESNGHAVATRPEYSVQFSNAGTWESATGYNKLNHVIAITSLAAPTNVIASAVSASQINLSWVASAGSASYRVERSTSSGGPYTQIATGLTATTYQNTGLAAATAYYYTVRAVNANGVSAASNQASATTPAAGGSPTIVIDGSAGDWSAVPSVATNGTGGIANLKVVDNAADVYVLAQGNATGANYQLFVDTDNSTAGSNEYTASSWPATGFDYMVENGNLYQYTGTGTNWSWNFRGAVTAVKNATVIEAKIPRAQLGALAPVIKIAAASINSGWTAVGHVPAPGGSGAAYTVGSIIPTNDASKHKEENDLSVFDVFPNPASSVLQIQCKSQLKEAVSIELYDMRGRRVKTIFSGIKPAGTATFSLKVDFLHGKYVLKLKAASGTKTRTIRIE